MNIDDVLVIARKHLGKGVMDSSARLCLEDAIQLVEAGNFEAARTRALKSIAYSVGIFHDDYIQAKQELETDYCERCGDEFTEDELVVDVIDSQETTLCKHCHDKEYHRD